MTIPPAPLGTSVGRIPVVDVSPVAEAGRFPAKAVVGEAVPVRATVFREGHDAVGGHRGAHGPLGRRRARAPGWSTSRPVSTASRPGWCRPATGDWTFRVEGWSDPYGTWAHDAEIKVEAGVDVELMLTEGALLLERAAGRTGKQTRCPTRPCGCSATRSTRCATSATRRTSGSRPACPPRCTPRSPTPRCATP